MELLIVAESVLSEHRPKRGNVERIVDKPQAEAPAGETEAPVAPPGGNLAIRAGKRARPSASELLAMSPPTMKTAKTAKTVMMAEKEATVMGGQENVGGEEGEGESGVGREGAGRGRGRQMYQRVTPASEAVVQNCKVQ